MLSIYRKNQMENLTSRQLKILRKIVREELE